MANLASAVWQDGTTALLLSVHGEPAPTDEEWHRYCEWIPGLLSHPNAAAIVITDGGAPSSAQREQMRKALGTAARWTAVITDKVMVRGVVTAIRWFNPKVCAFAPWELPEALKFVGVSGDQVQSLREVWLALDKQLEPRSRVLQEVLQSLGSGRPA